MALITLSELKTYLRITDTEDDTLLQNLIDETEAQIKKYVNNAIEEQTDITEYFNIDSYQKEIILQYFPVSNVSVYEDDTLLDSDTEYTLDSDAGIIQKYYGYFSKGIKTVKVIYTAGYSTIPDDIKLAVKIQSAFYYQRKDQIGISGQSLEGSINMTEKYGLLDSVKEMLNYYRANK